MSHDTKGTNKRSRSQRNLGAATNCVHVMPPCVGDEDCLAAPRSVKGRLAGAGPLA